MPSGQIRNASARPSCFRVITPDLRASGRSFHHGPLSWDLLADDIAALARHLDLAHAAVGGASFGSGVALRSYVYGLGGRHLHPADVIQVFDELPFGGELRPRFLRLREAHCPA
jgi:hypothetical protein